MQIICSLVALATALPQYGGGSAGGLLGHSQPLEHHIIGLSRGIEIENGGEEGGHEGGGGGEGGSEGGNGESIGFTGSHFNTPVDVHHEKEIKLKVRYFHSVK